MHRVFRLGAILLLLMRPLHAAEEDLASPPVVTARAWALCDPATGELLAESHADEPRKAASTAKTMCAYTVLRLAGREPAILEEWVAISALAAATVGSRAELTEGQSLQVRDCVLGLLLPSGNDAGNALAEHFHPRLAPPDDAMRARGLDNPVLGTRVNFIAEMNRHARTLGMTSTVYRSSFGDGGTEDDRTTTARDLCRLATAAMREPLFRTWVATRRHSASIRQPDGSLQRVEWVNSNTLLQLDLGYDGIKTGVTNQAGHCLVASARRGGDHLLLALLGSSSEAARDADARNLFRWAWTRRSAAAPVP